MRAVPDLCTQPNKWRYLWLVASGMPAWQHMGTAALLTTWDLQRCFPGAVSTWFTENEGVVTAMSLCLLVALGNWLWQDGDLLSAWSIV
jgi:hypothetical protein